MANIFNDLLWLCLYEILTTVICCYLCVIMHIYVIVTVRLKEQVYEIANKSA